ncbi:ankyrin repeat domain-containing protein [Acaryochloris sp. CCMEE 5410]|nr:ankyrin repeat domain-containing protein [Acaryochloris sp. CCMEE 5410]
MPGLVIAAQKGYTDIVEILLVAGANFASPGIAEPQGSKGEFGDFRASGPMAIWAAAVAGHQDILQILKSAMPEMLGQVLVGICERGSLAALHTLLAVIDVHQYYSYGPLQAASQAGRPDVVQILVQSGIDVNRPSITKETPLVVAADQGYVEVVKTLVEAGALVDSWTSDEDSPLFGAAYCGHLEVYNYLFPLVSEETQRYAEYTLHKALKRKAREQNTDVEAFIKGAMLGQMDVIQWGLRRGIDINAIGASNQTALMYAASSGLQQIVQILLEAGADPNIQSDDDGPDAGTTALMKVASHYACHFAENVQEIIKLLVAAGADPNLQDKAGRTALIHSVTWGYSKPAIEALKTLISVGADLNIHDNAGKTALIYAQDRCQEQAGFSVVVELLERSGLSE